MTALLPFLAAFLAATTDPAAAAPASEALIDRFMAVIPDSAGLDRIDRTADPLELDRLAALNPDRIDEIMPVLEAHAACVSPIRNARARSGLRLVARQLGEARLSRLIQFYEGEDFRTVDRLMARGEEALSAAEREQVQNILAAYPLAEFTEAMSPLNPAFWEEDPFAAEAPCLATRNAALTRLGLRIEDETAPIPED
jgi:hypothetical protein